MNERSQISETTPEEQMRKILLQLKLQEGLKHKIIVVFVLVVFSDLQKIESAIQNMIQSIREQYGSEDIKLINIPKNQNDLEITLPKNKISSKDVVFLIFEQNLIHSGGRAQGFLHDALQDSYENMRGIGVKGARYIVILKAYPENNDQTLKNVFEIVGSTNFSYYLVTE